MSDEWRLESSGVPACKRIVRNGEVVAMALQLTSGSWVVHDMRDRRIPGIPVHSTPAACLRAFWAHTLPKDPDQ